MEKEKKTFSVALVKELCPICCKEIEGPIVMNTILSEKRAKEVEDMNGKVIGFAKKPCEECQKYIDQGTFFIIGVDAEQTDDWKNPFRSGHIVGIKKESEFYKSLDEKFKKKDAVFMDYREMEKLGMIKSK